MAQPENQIKINISFYSFFKELTGCAGTSQTLPLGSTLAELIKRLVVIFPKLEPMQKSMLLAVGVEYQDRNYILRDGDEVSLFPPVQGG